MNKAHDALARQELAQLIRQLSFRRGRFVLASGKTADYYIDCRLTTLSGRGAYLIGQLLTPHLLSLGIDAVGGMSMGADPIVSSILSRSAELGHPINGFLVRKEAKSHGTGRQIEGHLAPWMRVALVEDVVTTGGSTLKAIDAVWQAYPSVNIRQVVTLVDRHEGGEQAITGRGIPFEALYSVREFL